MTTVASRETPFPRPLSGVGMLIAAIVLAAAGLAVTATANLFAGATLLIPAAVVLRGLVLVNPNQARVVLLFGRYLGTIREAGFYWVNPLTVRQDVSLRAHNFNSDTLKVNDRTGNPIEIGAVVVWRVRDTAQATFDVEDHESYVEVQTESALRTLAANHPYDSDDAMPGETSLRGSADVVNRELADELGERLRMAGVEVLECRLAHLAYAPEIAGAMLQRQQADAIIAARRRIVDGAVGMVQMALEELGRASVVTLDEQRKAEMVQNLLVVLCSERGTQPVIGTGAPGR